MQVAFKLKHPMVIVAGRKQPFPKVPQLVQNVVEPQIAPSPEQFVVVKSDVPFPRPLRLRNNDGRAIDHPYI